jgi:hypothetical protein
MLVKESFGRMPICTCIIYSGACLNTTRNNHYMHGCPFSLELRVQECMWVLCCEFDSKAVEWGNTYVSVLLVLPYAIILF